MPVWTEVGRHGGIRIDPSYRVAGLPRLEPDEARGLLFAVVPAIAEQLGLDTGAADHTLLPALEVRTETAARAVRDRLLVEPTHWFLPPDDTPALAEVARGVWESRELRLTYRGVETVVQPLGLILKGDKWYLLARPRRSPPGQDRLYRLARVEAVEVLDHRFERPPDFDLAAAWARRRDTFLTSLPEYRVGVRVAPAAEPLLALLEEGRPSLPLPADTARDEAGWALLTLRFERPDSAARQLLRLGADLEVLEPAGLRTLMAGTAARLASLYEADDQLRRST